MNKQSNGDATAAARVARPAPVLTQPEIQPVKFDPPLQINDIPEHDQSGLDVVQKPNVFESLNRIMQDVEAIGKNKENRQQNFQYRGIDDMYNELHPLFAKHGVLVIPETLESWSENRTTSKGTEMIYRLQKIRFTFYGLDGSSVSAVVQGEANDTGDKASNKSLAIALKYVLMITFLIPTEELAKSDPDQYAAGEAGKLNENGQAKQIQEPTAEQKAAAMQHRTPAPEKPASTEKVDKKVLDKIAAATSRPELAKIWNDADAALQANEKFIEVIKAKQATLPKAGQA